MQRPSGLLSVASQALHLIFSLCEATFRIQGISTKLRGKGSFPAPHGLAAQEQIIQCSAAQHNTGHDKQSQGRDGASECGTGGFLYLLALRMLSLLATAWSLH